MAGKTLSAHVGEEVARRVEQVAHLEARPVSQIVAAALAFYTRLPADAHQSLRTLEALGGAETLDAAARTVARALVGAEWELTTRRLAAMIPAEIVAGLDTEEDIMAAAVRLTSDPAPAPASIPTSAPSAAEPAHPRRRSRREPASNG